MLGAEGEAEPVDGVQVGAAGTVLELALPRSVVNHLDGDPRELVVVVDGPAGDEGDAEVELDRVPNLNSLQLFPDLTAQVEVTIVLDATGFKLPLDEVKPIDNPVPPARGAAAAHQGDDNPP